MNLKNIIVVSKEDVASCNIQKYLLQYGNWIDHDNYDGENTYKLNDTIMVTIEEIHLHYDQIDKKVEEQFGFHPELVIFASRHRAKSGIKTLTVHPLGNFSDAEFGGLPGKLVPASPVKMTAALRILKEDARNLEHQISYEATHHGPYLTTPTFFIEIGSDESAWREEEPAQVIARTILKVLFEYVNTEDRIALGIGGGHYVPRFTEIIQSHRIAFGHMVPNYATDMPTEMYLAAMEGTPGIDCVYFHRKSMKGKKYRELKEMIESNSDLEIVDSKILIER